MNGGCSGMWGARKARVERAAAEPETLADDPKRKNPNQR